MINYAIMIKDSDGIPVDIAQSIIYLEISLSRGSSRPTQEGNGIEKDDPNAMFYYAAMP